MELKIRDLINARFILFALFIVVFPSLLPLSILAPYAIAPLGLMLGMLIISFIKDAEDRKFIFKVFVSAYTLRILLAIFLHLLSINWEYRSGGLFNGFWGFFCGDGWGFCETGWKIATRLKQGISIDPERIKLMSSSGALHIYDYINAGMWLITDKSPLSMFFLNCFIGSVTIILVYFTARLVFEREICKLATILCAFWPSLVLWSTQNLKDPLTIFSIVLCFWSFISFLKRFNPIHLLIIFISIFFLEKFRSPVGIIITISFLLHLLFLSYKLIRQAPYLFPIVIVICVLVYVKFGEDLITFFNPFGGVDTDVSISYLLKSVDYRRSVRAYSRLALIPNYNISSPQALLVYLPIGLLAALFGPFPWQLFSASQIVAAPEMLVWYLMFPYLIIGLRSSAKSNSRYLFSMLVYIVFTILIIAIAEGNIGIMFRHRAIVLNFLFMFVAAGILTPRKRVNIDEK